MLQYLRRGAGIGLAVLLLTGAGCATDNSSTEEPGAPEGWETTTDSGVTFNYPSDMDKTYIDAPDWPPQIQVFDQGYTCIEAGDSAAPPGGMTEERIVNDTTYCITTEAEGAAGSTYTMYSYAFPKDEKTVIANFSLHTVQCANYDEPEQSACQDEQADLNVDELVDDIVQTMEWAGS